jgi:putative transposase
VRGRRHGEEQIIAILKQGEAGLTTAELCRQHWISDAEKAKYGGMDNSEAKRLKQLEDENRKPKHVVAELTVGTGKYCRACCEKAGEALTAPRAGGSCAARTGSASVPAK